MRPLAAVFLGCCVLLSSPARGETTFPYKAVVTIEEPGGCTLAPVGAGGTTMAPFWDVAAQTRLGRAFRRTTTVAEFRNS